MRRVFLAATLSLLSCALLPLAQNAASASTSSKVNEIAHQVHDCGAPMTVYTPADANLPLSSGVANTISASQAIFVRAAQRHTHWVSTFTCKQVPSQRRLTPRSFAPNTSFSSDNWSGYQVNQTSPNYVNANFTVPNAYDPNTQGDVSFWGGIGGGFNATGTPQLDQDGIHEHMSCDSGGCGLGITFWIEIVPQEYEQDVTNLPVDVGDQVEVQTAWNASQGAVFTLCDWTKNMCGQGSQSSPVPNNTAEWIAERPTVGGGGLPPLAKYGSVTFSACEFGTSSSSAISTISQGGAEPITMYGSGGTAIATVSPLGGDGASFTDHWVGNLQNGA